MVIWPKWAQLCPENHATCLTRTTTCSWKCCELPHSKKCQSYFSVPEWHSLEWGTAQRMIKYGDPDQMLLSHVPFSHLLFPAHVWPQDLYNNNNKNLKSMSIHASALPPLPPPALVSPHLLQAGFVGLQAEKDWSFLLSEEIHLHLC